MFYIHPVCSPWSAVPHLKRSTLRSVKLQGYNKSVLPVKKHSAHFFENVSAMIQAGLRLPLAFKTFPLKTARRRHGTLVHFKTTAIFLAVAPIQVLPSPSITGIFGRLAILFFINTKIKKRFLVSISPAVTPFLAEFVTHELLC